MITLKDTLLETGYFIDNEWLDAYVSLIETNQSNKDTLTEKHHILQRAYFKLIQKSTKEAKCNLVRLSFADHVRAHWLLYKCTKDELKIANEVAVRRMVNNRIKYNLNEGLTKEAYDELQRMWFEIKNDETTEYFSVEAEEFIKKHYNEPNGAAYCAKILGRSRHCITIKATKMGLRKVQAAWWSDEDIEWLKTHTNLSVKEQAEYLGRSKGAVQGKRRALGLAKPLESFAWTEEDLQFLKDNYKKLGRIGCSKILGRSPGAVQSQASYLGLLQDRNPVYCIETDTAYSSVRAAARALGITGTTIQRVLDGVQRQTHGYHFKKI